MGFKVNTSDRVSIDNRKIEMIKEKLYILLNKPSGYITTVKDQFNRPTVLDLVKEINERVFPVGRLDYNTSGLLILTNDGDFTFKMTHPKHKINKTYLATVLGEPNNLEISNFESGLKIEDYITQPAKLKIIKKMPTSSTIEITVTEGKNLQIRKMLEKINHPVISLKRIALGNIKLDNLQEGKWRYLTKKEVGYFN